MKNIQLAVLAIATGLSLSACHSWEDRHTKGTLLGGGIGAGVGVAIGAATGSWAWGMLIGAGAGALSGYIIADSSGSDASSPGASGSGAGEAELRRQEADRHFQAALSAKTPSESRYHIQRSLDLYPTPAAWNNLGTIRVSDGEKLEAERAFRKALDLDPGYGPARDNLARLRSGT